MGHDSDYLVAIISDNIAMPQRHITRSRSQASTYILVQLGLRKSAPVVGPKQSRLLRLRTAAKQQVNLAWHSSIRTPTPSPHLTPSAVPDFSVNSDSFTDSDSSAAHACENKS